MASWLERWQKRRQELAEGADADLVKANRKRYGLSFGMVVAAFALELLSVKLHLPKWLGITLRAIVVALFAAGIVLGRWAMHEHQFLTRPDPEGPPEIFRDAGR
jgi:hypothetical protein